MKRMHGDIDIDSKHARAQHGERHSLERVSYIASREPSDTPPDRNYRHLACTRFGSSVDFSYCTLLTFMPRKPCTTTTVFKVACDSDYKYIMRRTYTVVVIVFFTLTDRASTIPSNIRTTSRFLETENFI